MTMEKIHHCHMARPSLSRHRREAGRHLRVAVKRRATVIASLGRGQPLPFRRLLGLDSRREMGEEIRLERRRGGRKYIQVIREG